MDVARTLEEDRRRVEELFDRAGRASGDDLAAALAQLARGLREVIDHIEAARPQPAADPSLADDVAAAMGFD